ncbi:MAG: TonB-dependent receptor, partial [Pseudomonadota bacterium]
LTRSLDSIFGECAESFNVVDVTQPTDNYLASQNIQSYYFKSRWPLLKSLSLSTGMRYEQSSQKVDSFDRFSNQGVFTELITKDWLPGTSLTWKMNKKMQIRMAYSETISRPDLRELSNNVWQDFERGFEVSGNPDLKATVIESYDARWEWYFAPRENLSFGVFYKDFLNPIEQEFRSGSDPQLVFFNAQGAQVYGAEVELSKRLGFLGSLFRRFTLAGNYAAIVSQVDLGSLDNFETNYTNRPLQGQSNYTANVLLDYEHEPWALNASLAYNVYGKRIAWMESEGLPPVWELPFHQLDFVISKRFAKNFRVGAKFKNILDPKATFVQGDQVKQELKKGQAFTLGVSIGI